MKNVCKYCGHTARDMVKDCLEFIGKRHGPIVNGECAPCRAGREGLERQRKAEQILAANPVLKSSGFEAKAKRWNDLLAQARALKLTNEEMVEFIKKGQHNPPTFVEKYTSADGQVIPHHDDGTDAGL